MRPSFLIAAVAASLFAVLPVSAHHIWIEADGRRREDLSSASSARTCARPRRALSTSWSRKRGIVTPAGERPLDIRKTADGFALPASPRPATASSPRTSRYPVYERHARRQDDALDLLAGGRLRADRTPRAAVLDLDVVPVAGDKFQVVFKGKPLAEGQGRGRHAVGLGPRSAHRRGRRASRSRCRGGASTSSRSTTTTDEPGKRGEEAYDVMNYVTSLTVVQPQGLEPLPAPPPAKPY